MKERKKENPKAPPESLNYFKKKLLKKPPITTQPLKKGT